MGIFDSKTEMRTQLFFRDDMKFQFVKRPLQHSCLLERSGEKIKRAWKHFFCNQLPFAGYKNISADMVTLGYSRDIILDPFNKVPIGEELNYKPNITDKDGLKNWISKIASNMRHFYYTKRKNTTMVDRIAWAIMGIDFILVVVWAIKFATG